MVHKSHTVGNVTLRRITGGWEGDYGGCQFEVLGPTPGGRWQVAVRSAVIGRYRGTSLADAVDWIKCWVDYQ